jgi:hypothetical protein
MKFSRPYLTIVHNQIVFVPGKPFQPSLRKAGPSEALLGSWLTHKYLTRVERLVGEKHYDLFRTFVKYCSKKVYNIWPSLP